VKNAGAGLPQGLITNVYPTIDPPPRSRNARIRALLVLAELMDWRRP
jgi:hypothetical protein